ncbi:MAG: hypothetical protein U0797_10650 [Gemmataceae bacterium]
MAVSVTTPWRAAHAVSSWAGYPTAYFVRGSPINQQRNRPRRHVIALAHDLVGAPPVQPAAVLDARRGQVVRVGAVPAGDSQRHAFAKEAAVSAERQRECVQHQRRWSIAARLAGVAADLARGGERHQGQLLTFRQQPTVVRDQVVRDVGQFLVR